MERMASRVTEMIARSERLWTPRDLPDSAAAAFPAPRVVRTYSRRDRRASGTGEHLTRPVRHAEPEESPNKATDRVVEDEAVDAARARARSSPERSRDDAESEREVDADIDVDSKNAARPEVVHTQLPAESPTVTRAAAGTGKRVLVKRPREARDGEAERPTRKRRRLSSQEYRIVATGLKTEDARAGVVADVSALGGAVAEDVDDATTHVVTAVDDDGRAPRTMKYLQGVLLGKHIVAVNWLYESILRCRWAPEDGFEAAGDMCCMGAARKGRQRVESGDPPLFAGTQWTLWGAFARPPQDELTRLVVLGGGTLRHDLPRTASERAQHLVVGDASVCDRAELVRVGAVSAVYILDCVSRFALLDPAAYRIS